MAEDETLPIVTFGSLMTEGTALSRRGQHDKALGCFNDALKLRAGDKHCLITRSKCFLKLEKLLKDEDLMQSSTRQGIKVMDLVLDGISYLNHRRDFWQQQKPMYARVYERKLLRQGRLALEWCVPSREELV